MTAPPITCVIMTDSSKIQYASATAPTGSNKIATEIIFVLSHFSTQLNSECPSKVGMTASRKKYPQSDAG